jgi:hypothetical protein
LRDFSSADGMPGHFQLQAKVYGRDGQPCVGCGRPIRMLRQGQRSTYFCAHCQKQQSPGGWRPEWASRSNHAALVAQWRPLPAQCRKSGVWSLPGRVFAPQQIERELRSWSHE